MSSFHHHSIWEDKRFILNASRTEEGRRLLGLEEEVVREEMRIEQEEGDKRLTEKMQRVMERERERMKGKRERVNSVII